MRTNEPQDTMNELARAGLEATLALADVFDRFARRVAAVEMPLVGTAGGCCDIPPACWLPRCFGRYESRACPCGTALLRLRLCNCHSSSARIRLQVTGADDLAVKITPPEAVLGPLERKWFTVTVSVPEDACIGQDHDLLVRVAGCNEYYARWTVTIAEDCSGSCHHAHIDDCPDYVHHWYDHFYCARPCFHDREKR